MAFLRIVCVWDFFSHLDLIQKAQGLSLTPIFTTTIVWCYIATGKYYRTGLKKGARDDAGHILRAKI